MTARSTRGADRRRAARTIAALSLMLILIVGLPGGAAAHGGVLKSSTPADGAAVTELSEIVLGFTTPVLGEYSMFALTGTDGSTIAVGVTFAVDSRSVTLEPAGVVADGGYRLSFRVVADDGHPSTGSIGFTVGDPTATPPAPSSATPAVSPGLLSEERFRSDRALPWVLAGAGLLVAAGAAYLATRSHP